MQEDIENSKLAKEIEDCEDCPLYQNDCPGGFVGGPGGTPIEPPCCSWNEDDLIYEDMYSIRWHCYEPTKKEIEREEKRRAKKEREEREENHRREIEILRDKYSKKTGDRFYRHIEFRKNDLCDDWLCPYCHTWRRVGSEMWSGGFGEAFCGRCNKFMYYCHELELEDFPDRY